MKAIEESVSTLWVPWSIQCEPWFTLMRCGKCTRFSVFPRIASHCIANAVRFRCGEKKGLTPFWCECDALWAMQNVWLKSLRTDITCDVYRNGERFLHKSHVVFRTHQCGPRLNERFVCAAGAVCYFMRMQWLYEHSCMSSFDRSSGAGEWPQIHTVIVWGSYNCIHMPVKLGPHLHTELYLLTNFINQYSFFF